MWSLLHSTLCCGFLSLRQHVLYGNISVECVLLFWRIYWMYFSALCTLQIKMANFILAKFTLLTQRFENCLSYFSFHMNERLPHMKVYPFPRLSFANPDNQTLSALDKMVCQSPFVTLPFPHLSLPLPSLLSAFSDISVFPSEVAVEVQRAVYVIRLSMKLKYSCARSAPRNNRWCRLATDSQFPWQQPPSASPRPSSLWLSWVVQRDGGGGDYLLSNM